MPVKPSLDYENALWNAGYRYVAGVDEVGRGPLAGPVMAAAVILDTSVGQPWWERVRDSNELSPAARQRLFDQILQGALAVGVGLVSNEEIDRIGIVPATREAMNLALGHLSPTPDFALVDGKEEVASELPQRALVKGDQVCLSIACASIVAKVIRDDLMLQADIRYPGWGFSSHKGYGTPEHLQRLEALGPSPLHRRSYAPVRDMLMVKPTVHV